MIVIGDTRLPVKIWASDLEPEAEQQVRNMAGLPFIHSHVAVMADAHAGKGSTIGTVIATKGAIIPAAVGVDIGCGMCALKLPFKIDRFENLSTLRHSIERAIPTGHHSNKSISDSASQRLASITGGLTTTRGLDMNRVALQMGSLGGGNHFIEICHDTNNDAWIMLHSGSRNLGKTLAETHIDKAKGIMKSYFIDLPDPDLAFLAQGTEEFSNYINDLKWAQDYAFKNREEMLDRVIEQIYRYLYGIEWDRLLKDKDSFFKVNCHHNYTTMEHHFGRNVWITRKGAVSAREGEFGIIPGSMGTRSYIVKGKGNPNSFHSCSHGAGRRMSRTKARATYTIKDLEEQTMGIECLKISAILDEIPSSYKDIDLVMANQADLVEPLFELKQIMCIKGT